MGFRFGFGFGFGFGFRLGFNEGEWGVLRLGSARLLRSSVRRKAVERILGLESGFGSMLIAFDQFLTSLSFV